MPPGVTRYSASFAANNLHFDSLSRVRQASALEPRLPLLSFLSAVVLLREASRHPRSWQLTRGVLNIVIFFTLPAFIHYDFFSFEARRFDLYVLLRDFGNISYIGFREALEKTSDHARTKANNLGI